MELSDERVFGVLKENISNPKNCRLDWIPSTVAQLKPIADKIRTYLKRLLENPQTATDDQIWEAYNEVRHAKGVVGGSKGRTKGRGGVGGRSMKGSS